MDFISYLSLYMYVNSINLILKCLYLFIYYPYLTFLFEIKINSFILVKVIYILLYAKMTVQNLNKLWSFKINIFGWQNFVKLSQHEISYSKLETCSANIYEQKCIYIYIYLYGIYTCIHTQCHITHSYFKLWTWT